MAELVLRVDVTSFNEKMKAAQKAAQDVTLSTKETARLLKIVPKDAAKLGSSISSSMLTAQHDINGLNASLHSLHSLLQRAIPAIGVEEAIRRSITAYADYQTALTNMGKLTDQSFGEIDRQIKSLNPALGSYTELVEGYYQVISAGVTDATKALELLETASQAAKAAGVSQGDTIRALTSLMTGYAGQLKNSADAADVLFTIERYGKTSVQELVPYIGELSSVSRIAGVNVDSLGASLSVITQTAGSTATASTQVKALFLELTKESDSLKKVLSDMGKDTFQQLLAENGGDAVKALQAVEAQARKTGTSFSTLFGSQEAQIAAKNLIDLSSEYQKALQGIQDRTGAMTKAFGTYTETLNGLFKTTRSLASDLAVHIGEAFGGRVVQGITSLNESLVWLRDNFDLVKNSALVLGGAFVTLTAYKKLSAAESLKLVAADVQLHGIQATLMDRILGLDSAWRKEFESLKVLENENVKAAQSTLALAESELVAARQAELSAQVRVKQAEAMKANAVTTRQVTNAQIAEKNALVALHAAQETVYVKTNALHKAQSVLSATMQDATRKISSFAKIGAGFNRMVATVVSALGGPWGVALTAASAATMLLFNSQTDAERAAQLHAQALDALRKASEGSKKGQEDFNKELSKTIELQNRIAKDNAEKAFTSQLSSIRKEIDRFIKDDSVSTWSFAPLPTPTKDFAEQIANIITDFEKGQVGAEELKESFSGIVLEMEKAGLKGNSLHTVLINMVKKEGALDNLILYKDTLVGTNFVLNEATLLANDLAHAISQIGKASVDSANSIPGIQAALEKSRLVAYMNSLTTEQRTVASFLTSISDKFTPDQIQKALKGNFEGFTPEDAKNLQEIIKNVSTPKLKSSPKGTSEIDNAKEKIKQLKEEIDRLNGTDVKANTDLSQTIREIESVGAKAKLSGDEIKKIKEDYEAAFTTSTLKEFNKELLQAQGNTQELRAIEVADAINEWTQRLEALGLTEDEVTAKTRQLREAMNLQSQIKDAEAAANFYKEMAELSGNYGRSQEYVNKLLVLQADNLIRNVGITRELADEWLELQKIQNSREAWAGAYRATRQYFSESTNLAASFESLTTNAFSNMEDAMVDFAMTGKASFSDMVNSMIADLIRLTVRANITGPLADALGQGIKGLFNPGSWMPSSAAQAAASTSGYAGMGFRYSGGSALGNVFSGGDLSLYRNSVVTRPTFFTHDEHIRKYAKGAGLMGEAGPEAVMPLARMSDNNLGVRIQGLTAPQITINIQNNTPAQVHAETSTDAQGMPRIDVFIDEIDNRLAGRIGSGRSQIGRAIDMTRGTNRARSTY